MRGLRLAFTITLLLGEPFSPSAAGAQRATKVARMGYLSVNLAAAPPNQLEAFRRGNVTGLSSLTPERIGKCLELLTQTVPGVGRVAVLWQPGAVSDRTEKDTMKGAEVAARMLGVRLQLVEARAPADIDRAFSDMTKARAGALAVWTSAMFATERGRLVALAAKNRLPAVYTLSEFVDAGGLMAYGHSQADLNRRAATYVDKILKGAKPADLPVEQPTRFDLVIDLKTAKVLGLTIPPSVLARADHVVEN